MAIKFGWKLKEKMPIGYARFLCRLMGVRVETFGRPVRDRGVFLAANHTSYLDTVVLAAVIPVVFVAKSDVAGWPFFGIGCRQVSGLPSVTSTIDCGPWLCPALSSVTTRSIESPVGVWPSGASPLYSALSAL